MKNILFVALSISSLLVASSVAYYFVVIVPKYNDGLIKTQESMNVLDREENKVKLIQDYLIYVNSDELNTESELTEALNNNEDKFEVEKKLEREIEQYILSE